MRFSVGIFVLDSCLSGSCFTVFNIVVQPLREVSPSRGFFSQGDKNLGGFSGFGAASGLLQGD